MSDVVNIHVEVERTDDDGNRVTDRYPDTMGYAILLGELIIYDHNGTDIASYQDYEMITHWEVLVDGEVR
jgi:hypothetical protein